jgi:hypothetical protein
MKNKDQIMLESLYTNKVLKEDEENGDNVLKKYTYEILYKTDYKYDPKTKKAISWSYGSHSRGWPDLRHEFAYSDDDFWSKIDDSGYSGGKDELRKSIVIKNVEPADLREVEHEKRKNKAISDYYSNASKTGSYSGD